MRPTRLRTLLVLWLGAGAVVFLALRPTYPDPALPRLPRTAFVGLLLMAVAEATLAASIRTRLAGRPRTKPILPITVARSAALAKASSVAGSVFAGLWTGLLLVALGHRSVAIARDDVVTAAFSVSAAVLLTVGALRLEGACRTPDPPTGATGGPPATP